jgi:hypothetical protein
MAYNGSSAWYISSVAYAAVAAFAASTAYSAGQLIRQLTAPAVGSERVFVCIVAGTSGTEPTWVVTKGARNTSTTPVFQECTGEPGVNGDTAHCMQWAVSSTPLLGAVIYVSSNGSLQICSTSGAGGTGSIPAFSATAGVTTTDGSATWTSLGLASAFQYWKAPHARLNGAFATNWGANGNDFYVADNSSETVTAAVTLAPPGVPSLPCRVMSIDHTLSLPATVASLKAGATVNCNPGGGANGITLNGAGQSYWYGVNLIANSASITPIQLANQQNLILRMENCSLQISGTGSATIVIGGTPPSNVDLVNCTITFNATNQHLNISDTTFTWKNTVSAILGSAIPSPLINFSGAVLGNMLIEGVDLSAANSVLVTSVNGGGYACFKDCKINASATVTAGSNFLVDMMRCDSGGTNWRNERHSLYGDETTSTTIVRTGGASDGTTPVSHRIAPIATYVQTYAPFLAIPVTIWNGVTGTNRQVSLFGVSDSVAMPTNADFWFDVEYLGSAASPQGSFASGGIATQLTAPGAFAVADTSAWDSAATARGNSTGYVVGNVVKTASNPGRIFFCTAIVSTGISAASEPAGYASAVDGAVITDGNCTFRAGWRFKATLTLSSPQPAQAGYFTIYPKLGTSNAAILYVDPLAVLG